MGEAKRERGESVCVYMVVLTLRNRGRVVTKTQSICIVRLHCCAAALHCKTAALPCVEGCVASRTEP